MNKRSQRTLAAIEDGQHRLDSQAYAAETARLREAMPAAVRVRRPALASVPSHPLTLSPTLAYLIDTADVSEIDVEGFSSMRSEELWDDAAEQLRYASPQAGATSDLTVRVLAPPQANRIRCMDYVR